MAIERTEMIAEKRLVLDANILLRGVFGVRVRNLLRSYEDSVVYYSPEVCFEDARRYVPGIATRRGLDIQTSFVLLDQIASTVNSIHEGEYANFEATARMRIASRDEYDWPVVATALLLNAPIWTEDRDFFGTGIATWTSSRIELYLKDE